MTRPRRTSSTSLASCLLLALAWLLTDVAPARASPFAPRLAQIAAPVEPVDDGSLLPSGVGLGERRGYLAVVPGALGVPLSADSPGPGYLWGIDGGWHVPVGRVFKLQIGGAFEHSPGSRAAVKIPYGNQLRHWLRFGPHVRIGGGSDRVFGYAVMALLVDLLIEDRASAETVRRRVGPLAHSSVGAGVQGLLADRLMLGAEAALDVVGSAPYLRLRLLVGLVF